MHSPTDTPAPLCPAPRLGDVLDARCPSRMILSHVTSRWGGLVLIALGEERLRFAALRRRIGGVSERMLAQTLQQLEADGLVERRDHGTVPPHVDYRLTTPGREIATRYLELAHWIETNLPDLIAARPAPAEAD